MSGAERIAAERQRQVEQEGWTPEHDDEHTDGALADAAACYARCARLLLARWELSELEDPPDTWPWDALWWKPDAAPARNLEKAGALLAAEIDRLERKA